ncbi:hypothetical protein Tco_0433218, partial [Tanacetum coccineum]
GGLTIIGLELPIIDMAELVRLQICMQFDDTWDWVAMGLERQPIVAAGAPAVAEDAPAIDEGDRMLWHPCRHLNSHHYHLQLLLGLFFRD